MRYYSRIITIFFLFASLLAMGQDDSLEYYQHHEDSVRKSDYNRLKSICNATRHGRVGTLVICVDSAFNPLPDPYDNSQFGTIDLKTGVFTFRGQDSYP